MASTKKRARRRPSIAPATKALEICDSKLRLLGVALICVYVAAVPLVFDPGADWPFTVPKALLSHSLAYLLAAVLAGLFLRFGRDVIVWSWLHVPVLAFLVVNVVATVFAEDRVLALYGSHARMLGLGTIAAWTVLYFAVVFLVRKRVDGVAVVAATLGAAVMMLGYELIQLLGRDPFRWTMDTAARPFSTNGQPTSLAEYLTVLSLFSFALALGGQLSRGARGALVLCSGALLAGAAATGTRSVLIGLATGTVVLVGLLWRRHPSRRARMISAGTAAAGTLALAAALTLTPIGARLLQSAPVTADSEEENLARLDLASLDVRAVLYQVAIDVVRERPLLGYGPDNFVVGMTRHRPESGRDEARLAHATSAHSWIAQVATGSGLLGLSTFIAAIAAAGVLVLRSEFRAMSFASVSALAAFLGTGLTTVSDVGSDWLIWVSLAGIAASTATSAETDNANATSRAARGRSPNDRVGWSRYIATALCVALGAGLALTSLSAMEASRLARTSQDARLRGRVSQSIESGVHATQSDPGRAEYWQRLGLAYVGAARWREAGNALERAVQLAPWDARYISDLVQTQIVLARDGDGIARARALQLADDGVRRDPNYPPIHFTRAVVMQFTGNVPEAIRSIERALALDPTSRNGQWYISAAQLYVAAGRSADSARVARQGLAVVGSARSLLLLRIELARALLAGGQAQAAMAEVDYVLTVEPGNVVAQRLRSEIQLALLR